jgi:predicted O-methyltransferase YrrM
MNKFFLNELKASCRNRKIPIISDNTETFLTQLLLTHKPQHCLEIGSASWYSSIMMATLLNQRWWKILTIERAYPSYKECIANITASKLRNIWSYHWDTLALDIQRLSFGKFDFVFIDGRKSEYREYILKCKSLVARNFIIILDDAILYANKLQPVYEFFSKKQIKYEIKQLDADDGIIITSDPALFS